MVKVKVGKNSDFKEEEMKGFSVNGKEILIARVKGKLYAVSSVCTHKGGPLAEGELENYTVTCPWHFGQFDVRTGEVLTAPPTDNISTYKVEVKGEDVFVEIE